MPVADRRHAAGRGGRLSARRPRRSGPPGGRPAARRGARGIACGCGTASRGVLLEAVAPRLLARLAIPDAALVAPPVPPLPASRSAVGRCCGGRGLLAAHGRPHPRDRRRSRCVAGGRLAPPPTRHPEHDATRTDPDRGRHAGTSSCELEVFSGPLDLLLQLIESRQLDVLTVPLAEMADAYVEHLAGHPVARGRAGRLRVGRLAADPAQVASPAARRADARRRSRRRPRPTRKSCVDGCSSTGRCATPPASWRSGTWRGRPIDASPARRTCRRRPPSALPAALLADALQRLAAIPEPEPPPPEVVPREITIAMQIAALRGAMGSAGRVVLQRVLAACRSRTEVTVTVLAMLELVRRRQATVEQAELFGPILLRARATRGGVVTDPGSRLSCRRSSRRCCSSPSGRWRPPSSPSWPACRGCRRRERWPRWPRS